MTQNPQDPSAPAPSHKKVIISLLGFANASPDYQDLARSLVLNKNLADAELWAFESDRAALEGASFPSLDRVRVFKGNQSLLTDLQRSQLTQPVVLNPIGISPLKTFALPTIVFVIPLERPNLWAPVQALGSQSKWEAFSDLVLGSNVVIYFTHDRKSNRAPFQNFRDFLHQMGIISHNKVLEAKIPISKVDSEELFSWFALARNREIPWLQDSAPLVSIVTPSFNHARFIDATIKSVLNQSYPNFEYIVVDGGSKDGTVDILKRYEGKLTWISEPDRGYADAVRKGFARARGAFLCWLPSDDEFFDPDALTNLVSAIGNSDADLVFGNCIYVDEKSNWLDQYKTSNFSVSHLYNWCLIPQPSTLFSAGAYRKVQGINPDLLSVADYDLWLRIAESSGRFARIGKPISKYRLHSDSITTSKTAATYAEIIRLQFNRYGRTFPGWIRGAIGEIIHHLKGRPSSPNGVEFRAKGTGRFRLLIRSYLLEPVVIRIPILQLAIAAALRRLS